MEIVRRPSAVLLSVLILACAAVTMLLVPFGHPLPSFAIGSAMVLYLAERYTYVWVTPTARWPLSMVGWPLAVVLSYFPGSWLLLVAVLGSSTAAFSREQRFGAPMIARTLSGLGAVSVALLVELFSGGSLTGIAVAVFFSAVARYAFGEAYARLSGWPVPTWPWQRFAVTSVNVAGQVTMGVLTVWLWETEPISVLALWAPLAAMVLGWYVLQSALERLAVLRAVVGHLQRHEGASVETVASALLATMTESCQPDVDLGSDMVVATDSGHHLYSCRGGVVTRRAGDEHELLMWSRAAMRRTESVWFEHAPDGRLCLGLRVGGTLPPHLLMRVPVAQDTWPERNRVAEVAETIVTRGTAWIAPASHAAPVLEEAGLRDAARQLVHLVTATPADPPVEEVLQQLGDVSERVAAALGHTLDAPAARELSGTAPGMVPLGTVDR